MLLYEAGGTYGGLTLKGSGTYDVAAYESAFSTAMATEEAACIGGAEAAQVDSDATASGDPDPGVWDDHYCRQVAKELSMDTAFAVADPTSEWITVGRYGTGANPILDGGGTQDAGIYLNRSSTGGWKVEDLEISNFDRAGIDFENSSFTDTGQAIGDVGFTGVANGALLQRLNIHHIRRLCTALGVGTGTDCIVHPQGNGINTGNWPAMAGYSSFHANGVVLRSVNYLRMLDVQIDTTDGPFYLLHGRHWLLDDVDAEYSYWEHPYLQGATWGVMRNVDLRDMCALGYPDGAATLFWAGTRDFTLKDSTLKRSTRPVSPIDGVQVNDGVAFDGEANCVRTLFDNVSACGAGTDGCTGIGLAWIAGATPNPKHEMTLVMNSDAREYMNDGVSNRVGTLVGVSGASPTQQGRGLFIRNDFYPYPTGALNVLWLSTPPAVFTIPPGWYEHLNVLH